MATVNLGSIKFKWKGAYAGGTAYTVDDVVSYNGSSYICILASTGNLPTNTTYFEQMSSAGTDGTDLTSTLTTQGDVLYRDGSGLARLAAGTSGQVLTTGGSGANPSWGTVSSDFVKIYETTVTSSLAALSIDGQYTSDYDNYLLTITNLTTSNSGGGNTLRFRVNQGGVAQTGSDYYYVHAYNDRDAFNTADGGTGNHQDTSSYIGWQSNSSTFTCNATLNIFNPLGTSAYKSFLLHSQTYDYQPYSYSLVGNCYHKSTAASSGLTIVHLNGNITGGTVKLYGLK